MVSFFSQDHKEEVTCVSFNANDSYVASGSTSGDLVLHSLTTNLSSRPFGHGSNQVRLVLSYSLKAVYVLLLSIISIFSIWHLLNKKQQRNPSTGNQRAEEGRL